MAKKRSSAKSARKKTKSPSGCSELPDDKNTLLSGSFADSQVRVFMSLDGIVFGNEENVAAGIIMAE